MLLGIDDKGSVMSVAFNWHSSGTAITAKSKKGMVLVPVCYIVWAHRELKCKSKHWKHSGSFGEPGEALRNSTVNLRKNLTVKQTESCPFCEYRTDLNVHASKTPEGNSFISVHSKHLYTEEYNRPLCPHIQNTRRKPLHVHSKHWPWKKCKKASLSMHLKH